MNFELAPAALVGIAIGVGLAFLWWNIQGNRRLHRNRRYIEWTANSWGYSVTVFDGEEVLEEYWAGNNACSSSVGDALPPGSPHAESLETLQKWALDTAKDFAKQYKIRTIIEGDSAEPEEFV